MIKTIALFFVLVLLIGCESNQFWNDLKNLKFKQKFETLPQMNNSINETNRTITNATSETTKIFYNESLTNIFIPSANSILIIEKNISYVIDVPKENPKIINYLNDFDINELEFVLITIDKEEHNGGIQYIVVKSPPKTIYDNGIGNEYRSTYISRLDKYNRYWNRTQSNYITVLSDSSIGKFQLFVPYTQGLSQIKDENSIVVFYDKRFLYMSDCYGKCENKIPPVTTKYLVLANNGLCPTNSFDFVLSVGAKYVIGDEICEDLKEEMDIIGVKHFSIKNTGTIQILLGDNTDEIRTEK